MSLHPFCSKPHDEVSGTPGMETLWQVKMKPITLFIMFLFFQSTLVRVDGLFLKIPRLSRRSYVDKQLQINNKQNLQQNRSQKTTFEKQIDVKNS